MLTDVEMVAMRSAQAETFDLSCALLTLARTETATGGWTETAGTAGTAACRLRAGWPRTFLGAQLEAGELPWTLTLPHGTTINHLQKVTVAGHTLEVVGIVSAGSNATALQVACRESF